MHAHADGNGHRRTCKLQLFPLPDIRRRSNARFRVGLTPGQFELFALPRVRPSDRALKAALNAYYSAEETFRTEKHSDDDPTIFPDGTYVIVCSNWAAYVRRLEGPRAQLYGFLNEENPHSRIARECSGHDFAVVDNRFIVDGWVPNVAGYLEEAVLDLRDPRDAETIWDLYGPPAFWRPALRNTALEKAVDKETAGERKRALAGIVPRSGGPEDLAATASRGRRRSMPSRDPVADRTSAPVPP